MELEIVNLSDVGKRRPHNEDSTITDAGIGLVILADGMGGYNAGEVASTLAVITIYNDIQESLKHSAIKSRAEAENVTPGFIVKKAINLANSNIYKMAQTETMCKGMGTTIVTGLVKDNQIVIGSVGDSRLYRLRDTKFAQITKDHSLIQELIDRGLYSAEEANAKMPKNLVTRALGLDANVEVDIIEEQILPGDIYLLCSDGLNDMVNDEEIHLTLSKYSANLVQAAEILIQKANAKGGKDNISVVLVRKNGSNPSTENTGFFKKILKRN